MKCFLISLVSVALLGCSWMGEYAPFDIRSRDCRGAIDCGLRCAHSPGIPILGSEDTVIYVSAVCVPEDYDWERDTAYGCPTAEIVLFRNGVRYLSVTAGPAVSYDMHHIINGHLYSHWCENGRTIISVDGEQTLSFQERECIVGLVPTEKGLYSLGNSLDGQKGLCFRFQGEILARYPGARAVGGFSETSYGSNGALCRDGDNIYYSFVYNETVYYARDGNGISSETFNRATGSYRRCFAYGVKHDIIYEFGDNVFKYSGTRELSRVHPAELTEDFGKIRLFSAQNGILLDNTMYLAINPSDSAHKPKYTKGKESRNLDVNGFLSGIEVVTNPPN